ncbi:MULTISPECIES: DUF2946 domain-containing protein [Meiothermus]|uniref:DUF2946 domain-containing protein n=1 Tax=Meiothermus TaxID=65551 RepID=UPI0011BDC617|nr:MULTISPECIES: DUF2946 domain-containing protein [Meiothermus]
MKPKTPQPFAVMGWATLVLCVSLMFGLRGMVMFPAEPVQIDHHLPAHSDTDQNPDHQGHCPLCFLQMLLPWLAPALVAVYLFFLKLRIGTGECCAREEFLEVIAARGPPI